MEGGDIIDLKVSLCANTNSSLHFLLMLREIRVSAAPGLSLTNRNLMWAGPRQRLKSGNSSVFICRKKERLVVCVHTCARGVCVWVCVPYAVCQGGLSGTCWCACIVVNNSSKHIKRWQLWCVWQFYSRTRQDLVTHAHRKQTCSATQLSIFVEFSILSPIQIREKQPLPTYPARLASSPSLMLHIWVQALI